VDCIFLIRFDSMYSLFFAAVIVFYSLLKLFYSLLVLRYLLCPFNVSINVITTSSNHARPVYFTALLFESPFALIKSNC